MAVQNPVCKIKDGAAAYQSTDNGVNVTPGNVITIALVDPAGVDVWALSAVGGDDLTNFEAVVPVINMTTMTATFTMPAGYGRAIIFQSQVQRGIDRDIRSNPNLTTTFGLFTLTGSSDRVLAVNERFESSLKYGWIADLNRWIRLGVSGGASSPPTNSIQAAVIGGTFRGATNAAISDDGSTTHGSDPATTGDDRFSSGAAVFVKGSSDDLCVWQHQYTDVDVWPGAPAEDALWIGGFNFDTANITVNRVDAIRLRSNRIFEYRTVDATTDNGSDSAYLGVWGKGAYAGNPNSHGVYCGPNFYFRASGASDFEGESDPFFGARGVIRIDKRITDPTETLPAGGLLISGNPTTGRPEALLAGDDPSAGWRDLLAGSGGTTVNVTSTTPGDITITSSTRVVNCNASGSMTINGFSRPTTPAAGVITVTNHGTSQVVISTNTGVTAANGVTIADSLMATLIQIPQHAAITLAYDYNEARWVPTLGVTLSAP